MQKSVNKVIEIFDLLFHYSLVRVKIFGLYPLCCNHSQLFGTGHCVQNMPSNVCSDKILMCIKWLLIKYIIIARAVV